MKAERLAEWRKFAIETIPQIARLSDESESERVIISTCATAILELIDALTAERARAEKALALARELLYVVGNAPVHDYERITWATRLKELSK